PGQQPNTMPGQPNTMPGQPNPGQPNPGQPNPAPGMTPNAPIQQS
ncbi:MAG: hypothetical protein CK431_29930, partial [Mycobacterium sp.]